MSRLVDRLTSGDAVGEATEESPYLVGPPAPTPQYQSTDFPVYEGETPSPRRTPWEWLLGIVNVAGVWGAESMANLGEMQGARYGIEPEIAYTPWEQALEGEQRPGSATMAFGTLASGGLTGGIMPAALLAEGFSAMAPETPEESAQMFREAGMPAWMGSFFNWNFASQMTFDPLNAVDAVGLVGRLTKAARGTPLMQSAARMYNSSPVRQVVDDVLDASFRAVRRVAVPLQASGTVRLTGIQDELVAGARAVEEALPEGMTRLDITSGVTEAIEQTGRLEQDIRLGISEIPGAYGLTRQDIVQDMVMREFPQLADEATEAVTDYAHSLMRQTDSQHAWEILNDMPTPELTDLGYLYRTFTEPFRKLVSARRVRPVGGNVPWDPLRQVGAEVSGTLSRRNMRETVRYYNSAVDEGRAWLTHRGRMVIAKSVLNEEKAASTIGRGWSQIDVPIFVDDPTALVMQRALRGTRAVSAGQFLLEIQRRLPQFGRWIDNLDSLAPEDLTIASRMRGAEWNTTFGRLPENNPIRQVAEHMAFKDTDTLEAAMSYSRLQARLEDPRISQTILNYYEKAAGVWRMGTLLPFLPTHGRNILGAIMNAHHGGVNVLDLIDGVVSYGRNDPMVTAWLMKGGGWRGEIGVVSNAILDQGWLAPISSRLSGLSAKKVMNVGFNLASPEYWGAQLMSSVENSIRYGMSRSLHMKRGMNMEDAVKETLKWQIDYGDVPRWFRSWGQKWVGSFPTWTLKNIPLQLEGLLTHPGFTARSIRPLSTMQQAAGADWRETPGYIKAGAGVAIPMADPDKPAYIRTENVLPISTLFEAIPDVGLPMTATELKRLPQELLDTALSFGYNLLNPFVTEIGEQLQATGRVETGGFTSPTTMAPIPPGTPGAEMTGYDPFFERPIVRPYVSWNPFLSDQPMPEWAQRTDHAARSFVRLYNEWGRLFTDIQQGRGLPETLMARFSAIPVYSPNIEQTINFNLRDLNKQIAEVERDAGRALESDDPEEQQDGVALRELYLQRLSLTAHGSFAKRDPFTGEPRPWANVTEAEGFTVEGRKSIYQEALQTCWLLMIGATGPSNQQRIEPLNLDDTEKAFVMGLMNRLIDSYVLEMTGAAGSGEDIDLPAGMGYPREQRRALTLLEAGALRPEDE